MAVDRLKPESLQWALTHISRFGDTDIFPVPFEYDAIKHGQNTIIKELSNIDLSNYEPQSLKRFLIPKPRGGFRVAIHLDPIDTLIYTAMIYEAAGLIEHARIPLDRRIACSYRIETDEKGQLFREKNGWPDFFDQSKEFADSGEFAYVLTADIADFYNQISHHRVRSALESSGVSPERSKDLENYLMNLTARQSRGIPVGPSASIVLSESCLNDVDTYLLRKGYLYTRYSDDFRIFCKNRLQAYKALHDLSDYLYTSHRLTLQSSKIAIMQIKDFIEKDLIDPQKLEEQGKTNKLNELISILQDNIAERYSDPENTERMEEILANLPEKQLQIARENLVELLDSCISQDPLHLGLARYLLRRATSIRTGALTNRVVDNLEILSPVMRDASRYIIKSTRAKNSVEIRDKLISYIENSDLAFIPYIRLWFTEIILKRLVAKEDARIYSLFESYQGQLGIRPLAQLAKELELVDWVRERKEIWNNHGPWEKRSIIWAASVLPTDEKRFWLQRVRNSGDLLERVVAGAVMGM